MFEGCYPSVSDGDQWKKDILDGIILIEEAIGRMKARVMGVEGLEEDVRNLHI